MTKVNERVTVDFDSESYYLDGEYWESWDNYGEEMADKINELLKELEKENKDLEEARSYYQENFLTMKTERNQLKEENKQLQSKLEQYEKIMSDFDVSSFDELRTIMEQGCGV